ncbi:MAG: EF-P lysine aminoacylase EpmA [Woeseia sp.]
MQAHNWRPTAPLATARHRAQMLGRAREFFASRGVLEVETPLLSQTTVTDPHIESIRAELQLDAQRPYFLQTSPEYFMKRLLAAGYPDIFQICKAFRDGECGRRHQPEFTLVEWYRRDYDLQQIMREASNFITLLLDPRFLRSSPLFVEYAEMLRQHTGIDPGSASLDQLVRAAEPDRQLIDSLGDDRDAWLDLLLSTRVTPHFADGRLTVLYHYPAAQAALARLCEDDSSVADRFEIFFGDLELANGFVELQSAEEQSRRFARDQEIRRQRSQRVRPLDRRLLAALEEGLPDCAGVAVGFDRLLMINEMADDIRRVQSFADGDGGRAAADTVG